MEVEIGPTIEPVSPVSVFCARYTSEDTRRDIATQMESAEPLKDVIVTSEMDDELNDLIRLKLKTFENVKEDAATHLLATDALLANYQVLLRKLSIPVLELAQLAESGESYDAECLQQIAGNLLCQLVMFNERLIQERRAKILKYLGKPVDIAGDHRIPQRCGEALFGKWFIDEHQLVEMKRRRKKPTQNSIAACLRNSPTPNQRSVHAKRRRKWSEGTANDESADNIQILNAESENFNKDDGKYCIITFYYSLLPASEVSYTVLIICCCADLFLIAVVVYFRRYNGAYTH